MSAEREPSDRRPGRLFWLLAMLTAGLVVLAVGSTWWVLNTLSHIEERLPGASLATARDFGVLLQDLQRLDRSLEILPLQPEQRRLEAANLALDFAVLRARDNRSLYGHLGADYDRLEPVLGEALTEVEEALETEPLDLAYLRIGQETLQGAIDQTKWLYDRTTYDSSNQLSTQASRLKALRASLGLLSLVILVATVGLVGLMLWQRHVLQRWAQARARLQFLALHDPLTGLPNRTLFQDRLAQACAQARRDDRIVALLYLDLDHFKEINDSLGHPVGDALLREVGQRLQRCVRATDTVARLGGDEFAILLIGLTHPRGTARVAQAIIDAVSRPVRVQGQLLQVSTSAGITVFPQDGESGEQLLANADMALYRAKAQACGHYHFFIPAYRTALVERRAMEKELRRALRCQEFVLYYQPQIHLTQGGLDGLEALVRWQHPRRGLVPPAEFLPLAEESGLIVTIGRQVLRQACDQMRAWRDAGLHPPRVAINLATAQFKQGDLVEEIRQGLTQAGLAPRDLEVEITEGTILDRDSAEIQRILAGIRELGVEIALDDFGTGYASLTHLKRFPVNRLKIDRSFVQSLGQDADDEAIVKMVIQLGHSLGLAIVAEGIETAEQAGYLSQQGCDVGQGYLFGRPMPAEEVTLRLRSPAFNGDERDQGVDECWSAWASDGRAS
ncbi:EAL domain-containing protein [Halomonas campisalis]|uniref:EAL domain-containing protein n=1 Tax=Billgrantia campisalis TaxID=74661 RepID=A0ABS9PBC8_9GAMM|nr:EAL domain-containing protein [Halomonas campisalis]MCG6659079.1 EAL domain-containing protein [Halomonas campisalis]MDR5863887.1 EAL domain-containing protein [Halomonas campisalis]